MPGNKGFFASLFDYSFSSLITTKIIKVFYIIITVVVSLGALAFLLSSLALGAGGALIGIIGAPLFWLVYMIAARISLEMIIVIFRIGEDVRFLAAGGGPGPGGYPPAPSGYSPPPGQYPPPPAPPPPPPPPPGQYPPPPGGYQPPPGQYPPR